MRCSTGSESVSADGKMHMEMYQTIELSDIICIDDPSRYKLHLACRNRDGVNPLDVFTVDRSKWLGWNEWRGNRNDWTREYVFSLIEFYPRPDSWLFGGVFKVIERQNSQYKLEELDEYRKFSGRLILSFHRYQGMRGRAYYLEKYVREFRVAEILPSIYNGESFPGFENVSHDFSTLEPIFHSEKSEWKQLYQV